MTELHYCEPIPYEGCTVEFAETPGGLLYSWRITSETDHWKGRTRIGICEWGARAIFYYDYEATRDTLDDDFEAADREDCKAIKSTWAKWEAILESADLDRDDAEQAW